jgi:hypothetical protein
MRPGRPKCPEIGSSIEVFYAMGAPQGLALRQAPQTESLSPILAKCHIF